MTFDALRNEVTKDLLPRDAPIKSSSRLSFLASNWSKPLPFLVTSLLPFILP